MTNPVEQICEPFSVDTHTPSPTTHPHTHTRFLAEASSSVMVGGSSRWEAKCFCGVGYGMRPMHCGSGFYRDVGEAQNGSLTQIIALPL